MLPVFQDTINGWRWNSGLWAGDRVGSGTVGLAGGIFQPSPITINYLLIIQSLIPPIILPPCSCLGTNSECEIPPRSSSKPLNIPQNPSKEQFGCKSLIPCWISRKYLYFCTSGSQLFKLLTKINIIYFAEQMHLLLQNLIKFS